MILTLLLAFNPVAAQEASAPSDEEEKSDDGIEEELSELEDADYPDLVAADETGEIIDEFTLLADDAMVELAARHKQDVGMSPSAITVITRRDIEASGANTIPDLLRQVPGMEVMVSTPYFTAITARLYFTNENNHYLVLLDGREVNIELLGQPFWEIQPISLEDIERIEVIRGPGSALYGANALAGVISITTKAIPEETTGWIRLAGGDIGNFMVDARGSTKVGNWGFSLSAGADVSGMFEYPRTSAREIWKLRALAEYRWPESRRVLIDFGVGDSVGLIAFPLGLLEVAITPLLLRLAYQSEELRGQLTWTLGAPTARLEAPLNYGDIPLAKFGPFAVDGQTLDADVQWTLPRLWDPLLLIVGGGGRISWLSSDQLLDAETYADITSPDYHKPGISYWEGRGGAFVHAELAPTDWVTVTSGARLDFNSVTGAFVSPRLAAVFRPVRSQFIRMAVARAYRKPAFLETSAHLMVDFPPESPIQGPDREKFQEFMTRVLGNSNLGPEKLLSFEIGYLGKFLDNSLTVTFDVYYHIHTALIFLNSVIEPDPDTGLIDLDRSSFMFINKSANDIDIIGSELSIRYSPSRSLMLLASWTHRELISRVTGKTGDWSPKNMITLGGRFQTESGLVGSLYAHARSESWYYWVPNPEGLLAPLLPHHFENNLILIGRLGWRTDFSRQLQIETGVKLFLPVSPFRSPHFRFREMGGGVTRTGKTYGSDELRQTVTAYLQASF
ncbi:TonB-dependent receptor plug domain-containing protein [Myxococcota bacterium]